MNLLHADTHAGEMCIRDSDDPDKVTIIWDHCLPTAVAKNDYDHYEAGLALAKRYGIKKLHIGEGICHTIMHEAKYAKPGQVATATDKMCIRDRPRRAYSP